MAIARTAELWAQTRLAHEAMMLDDAHRVLAADREAVNGFRRGMLGEAAPVPETDSMGVRVGDEHHFHQAPPPPTTSPWAKAAIGAAIGFATAGPIGAAVALPSILQAMRPAAVPVDTDTDTDTTVEVRLGAPPVDPPK